MSGDMSDCYEHRHRRCHPGHKASRPLRRAVGAVVIPADRFERWHTLAIQTECLDAVELGVLAAICDHFRHFQERGCGMTLSYDRMAYRLDVNHVRVRWAVTHLVELGLVGVERGGNGRANEYRMALPRRVAKSLATAAAYDVTPF
jgi:hypothetical protein